MESSDVTVDSMDAVQWNRSDLRRASRGKIGFETAGRMWKRMTDDEKEIAISTRAKIAEAYERLLAE